MKSTLALIIALLMLLLCACGQETAPVQTGEAAEETHSEQTAETNADGYYVEEETLEDGSTITTYRDGGPDGAIVKAFYQFPEGVSFEEHYSSEGKLEYVLCNEADGSVYETFFYPSGNIHKDIAKLADGSGFETHYLDNGKTDPETGTVSSGTVCYEKYITPDGQVEEFTYDIREDEDGTTWSTDELDDGTVIQTHYGVDGMPIEQLQDNEARNMHTKIEFYENGNEKSRDSFYGDNNIRSYIENYEDGNIKYSLLEYDDGSKREEKFNEAGYTVYYFDSNLNMEFFADDTGELVKYVEAGKVYEGNAIPGSAREMFNQVRIVPAEDTVMTQGEDGSNSTTTTYADGTVSTSTTAADGSFSSETVKTNGERNYEEYYANGHLKLVIYETAETYQEAHYDEEGYYTYFYNKFPGQEMEITCDETGKVNKVLVNGKEQTDIESYVKDMFFRSW